MTEATQQEKALITKYDLLFESRLSKTEESLKHLDKTLVSVEKTVHDGFREIRGDMKWLLGLMLTTTGATLLIMAHGFHWIP